MKKLLIASAALAMVAGTAQAQSSVTIYGTLDTGWDQLKSTVSDVSAGTNVETKGDGIARQAQGALTSSRLGFRGTEDIGGGLRANFNLEYEINPGVGRTATGAGDGATTAQMRTSTVGLAGKFGTVNIGRQLTGIHNVVTGFSPLPGNNMVGEVVYSSATRLPSTEVRADNSISFITPTVSGLNGRVDWAKDSASQVSNVSDSGTKADHLGLSANYAVGALRLAAATHTTKTKAALVTGVTAVSAGTTVADVNTGTTVIGAACSITGGYTGAFVDTAGVCVGSRQAVAAVTGVTAANDQTKVTVNAYAAQYTIGQLRLNAILGDRKVTAEGTADATKSTYQQIGASYSMGKTTLVANYGEGDLKTAAEKSDRSAYQLGAIYNLSKRTNVYGVYGSQEQKVKNSADAATIGDKTKSTQLAIGLRHSF